MSERDVLDEAFEALRLETARETADTREQAAATRRALLVGAMKRRRKLTVVRLVLPLAAVLAVATAWAAATGRLERLIGSSESDVAPAAPTGAGGSASPASSLPVAQDDADAGAAALPEESPVEDAGSGLGVDPVSGTHDAGPHLRPAASASAPAPRPPASGAPSPEPPAADVDPEVALYETAHEAHFVARDWTRALAGWDAYLAAHPKGRFAPEARYNRALALFRLGRRDEARDALRPFANGAFDGYRQKEAQQLLDAMK